MFNKSACIREYVRLDSHFRNCDALVPIYGDSMAPAYVSGDLLIIKEGDPNYLQWGRPYLVVTGDKHFFKYLRESRKPVHVILHSRNEHYGHFDVPIKKVWKFFEVRGFIRRLE